MYHVTYKKLSRDFSAKDLKKFFDETLPGKDIRQCRNIVKFSSVIIGAFDKDKLIGIARALDDTVYAFICDILVNPNYRGQGIGTKITEELVKQLVKRNIKVIHCSTSRKFIPFLKRAAKFKYDPDNITLYLKNF
jgi:ribosomal protein S18 acetylase RimI-like enzyme